MEINHHFWGTTMTAETPLYFPPLVYLAGKHLEAKPYRALRDMQWMAEHIIGFKPASKQGPNGIYNSESQSLLYCNREKLESKSTIVLWGFEDSSAKERLTL